MKINGINKVNEIYKTNNNKKVNNQSSTSKKDSIAISQFGKDLQIAKDAVKNVSDIRMEKVSDIKKRIEAGTYNITAEQVADKILKRL